MSTGSKSAKNANRWHAWRGFRWGCRPCRGNHVELVGDWQAVFQQLIEDIDAAEKTCHLEFYIWQPGGTADEVAAALIRARRRGVVARVLVDAMGSRTFLRSKIAAQMREVGIEILAALPGGLLRMPFVRFDLRMHRKIVVVDGRIAYTGSLNLGEPRVTSNATLTLANGSTRWCGSKVRRSNP